MEKSRFLKCHLWIASERRCAVIIAYGDRAWKNIHKLPFSFCAQVTFFSDTFLQNAIYSHTTWTLAPKHVRESCGANPLIYTVIYSTFLPSILHLSNNNYEKKKKSSSRFVLSYLSFCAHHFTANSESGVSLAHTLAILQTCWLSLMHPLFSLSVHCTL